MLLSTGMRIEELTTDKWKDAYWRYKEQTYYNYYRIKHKLAGLSPSNTELKPANQLHNINSNFLGALPLYYPFLHERG
ncbi:hypothetical protein [Salibacterium salarium]|uniref:hypothetical protein n=1 Tax=Salibacterium salarium TaxID=284579 RepID=UPI000F795A21|nr:hypothetical protein [Salibacterium salarium]